MASLFRSLLMLLLVAAAAFVLIPLAAIAVWIAYWKVVPVYSASTQLADLRTTLTLRFYSTEDESADHGRYLYVTAPNGSTEIAMTAFDWAHNSRTSICLTPQRKIGIIGPVGDDYLLSLDPLKTDAAREPSDDWTYLGAFDFQGGPRVEYQLRFVSAAEQAECIPMRGGPISDFEVRKAARQENCSHYYVNR
jgi:hypothetical protein